MHEMLYNILKIPGVFLTIAFKRLVRFKPFLFFCFTNNMVKSYNILSIYLGGK